jgi:hypothetical protein
VSSVIFDLYPLTFILSFDLCTFTTLSLLLSHSFVSVDPINIFFGVYKSDNAPLRLSYHGSIHYNSVVDPFKATIGVGLGLAGHKPGVSAVGSGSGH